MLLLHVLHGPDAGKRFLLTDDEPQHLGRYSEALPLTDNAISKQHAELTPDGEGGWSLHDLDSTNGTYVNDHRIGGEPVRLKAGDHILVGQTTLLFGAEPGPEHSLDALVVMEDPRFPPHIAATRAEVRTDSMVMAWPAPADALKRQAELLLQIGRLLAASGGKSDFTESVLSLVFEKLSADRAFVLLLDVPGDITSDLRPAAIRTSGDPPAPDRPITFSHTVAEWVLTRREGVLSASAQSDARFSAGDSIQGLGLRSVLSVPIISDGTLWGLLELDSARPNWTYTEEQLELLAVVAGHLGMGLQSMRLQEQRLAAQRLAAVGEAVASISHSVKNMLQAMRSGSELVEMGLKKGTPELVNSGWDIVSRSLDRFQGLAMNMLQYSRPRTPEVELNRLQPLFQELQAQLDPRFAARSCAFIMEYDPEMPPVPHDPHGMHHLLLNLALNALEACRAHEGVVILKAVYDHAQQRAFITVRDNGHGIAAEVQPMLFTAFHSTKGYSGTGLGLSVARKIAEEHGGSLTLDNQASGGAVATLSLPIRLGQRKQGDTHVTAVRPREPR